MMGRSEGNNSERTGPKVLELRPLSYDGARGRCRYDRLVNMRRRWCVIQLCSLL